MKHGFRSRSKFVLIFLFWYCMLGIERLLLGQKQVLSDYWPGIAMFCIAVFSLITVVYSKNFQNLCYFWDFHPTGSGRLIKMVKNAVAKV